MDIKMNRRSFLLGSIAVTTLITARITQTISQQELLYIIRATRDPTFPVGTLLNYAGTKLPLGWLPADGRSVDREAFADLFAVIGSGYGKRTLFQRLFKRPTFNIPDLTGRRI